MRPILSLGSHASLTTGENRQLSGGEGRRKVAQDVRRCSRYCGVGKGAGDKNRTNRGGDDVSIGFKEETAVKDQTTVKV